jgi:hypothetical protein
MPLSKMGQKVASQELREKSGENLEKLSKLIRRFYPRKLICFISYTRSVNCFNSARTPLQSSVYYFETCLRNLAFSSTNPTLVLIASTISDRNPLKVQYLESYFQF